jgi:excinuclease ABC subunit C
MHGLPASVLEKIPHLPETPGVYVWRNSEGRVLYVGKAKRLRSRVRSYTAGDHQGSLKTRLLMEHAAGLETIVVPTEAHALILEANLIKEHRPRFNIALRDDKSYPYIKVTVAEPFPRVYVTRRVVNDGSRYFGPYTDVSAMRRALNVVKRIFTVRSCNFDMPRQMPERPCLDYHIGRCKAPCILAQTQAEYAAMIDEVLLFLDGRTEEVTRRVRERMELAAESLEFERAAELRDVLRKLQKLEEPTVVLELEGGDRDVIGYARDAEVACVALLRIRQGKLLARDHQYFENLEEESDQAVLQLYLAGQYRSSPIRAGELLIPFDVEERDLVEESLESTRLHVPQRGPRRELVGLAQQNARHLLEELRLGEDGVEERAADPVYELQRELGLKAVPRTLVCFDISHAQGTDVVASCVWFQNGRPFRSEYRKFRIKSFVGNDDFAAMREVVGRYFRRRIDEGRTIPDLVVIDGGKGQLHSAHEALREVCVEPPALVSIAKRNEELFVFGRIEPLRLGRRSPALRLVQQARDEAHRFAITYQRKRRSARTVTSELLRIPGIGEKRRRSLLHTFGSLDGVRAASPEQIGALPGFSVRTAERLLASLRGEAPDRPPGVAAEATPEQPAIGPAGDEQERSPAPVSGAESGRPANDPMPDGSPT